MIKYRIPFQAIGHYHCSQQLTGNEKSIWIILHGYGQLASFFLKKFSSHFREEVLFIAPEATNHAYLEGFSGRVGANWMTKHERESAIASNNNFLNDILYAILMQYDSKPNVHVLGFSQGAATASRWAVQSQVKIQSLVLWSGGFAHDLDFSMAHQSLAETKVSIVLGESDEFLTEEALKKQEELIQLLSAKVELIRFAGGHEIDQSVFSRILLESF